MKPWLVVAAAFATACAFHCEAASTVEFCKPYTSVSQLAVDLHRPFLQYTLSVDDSPSGRKIVTLVGDELLVDRNTLGVIVRAAAAADATIEKIRLLARVVRIVDTVPLINGTFEIEADEISLLDGGTLTILPDINSKINLSARTIRISDSGFKHFDIRARVTTGKPDDFADIKNILTVSADKLLSGNSEVPADKITSTLAGLFSRFPITDFTTKIDQATGQAGHARWVAIQKAREGTWPRYSIAVLRSAFRVAPFDDCTRQDINSAILAILPVIQDIGAAETVFESQAILDSIKGNVDLEGNGPAYASNRPLGDMLSDLNGYVPTGAKLAALDFDASMLASAVANTPIDPAQQAAQLGQLTDSIRLATIAYQNTNNDLIAIQSNVDATIGLLKDQRGAYEVRQARLKEHAEDLKKGAQDRAQIISALSTAAAIATTAYTGSPQTGSAVGGVIYAIGNAEEGKKPFESLSAGVQFANAIQGPLTSLTKTVSDLKTSRATYDKFIDSFTLSNVTIKKEIDVPVVDPKPGDPTTQKYTRDQALRDLSEKASALKSGIDDIKKVYVDFTPQPSPLPSGIEEDDSLKDWAARIAATLEDAKRLTVQLDTVQRTIQDQSVALVGNAERLSKLTNLPVSNEARRRMYAELAIESSRDELAKFASLVDQLRRVSIVEFRAPLPVSPIQIQNTFVAEQLGQGFDQNTVLKSQDIGKVYLDLLNARRTQITFLAGFVANASEQQFRQYVQARGGAPINLLASEDFTDSAGAPDSSRRFIRQVNQLIDAQFKARANPAKLQELYKRQLELPLDVREKIDQRYPARLLQVAITDVRPHFNLTGGDLVFRIEVDRVGNLRKASTSQPSTPFKSNIGLQTCAAVTPISDVECFSVDLRPKTTPPEFQYLPFEYTIGTILAGNALVRTPATSYWYLKPGDTAPSTGRTMMVTYSPAEARMFLKIRLDPRTSWASPPIFSRISVSAEVFQ